MDLLRVDAKAFGDHVTADHVISNDETYQERLNELKNKGASACLK